MKVREVGAEIAWREGEREGERVDSCIYWMNLQGVLGLYRGIAANTLKVIPNNAIRWMVFEHLKQSTHFKSMCQVTGMC